MYTSSAVCHSRAGHWEGTDASVRLAAKRRFCLTLECDSSHSLYVQPSGINDSMTHSGPRCAFLKSSPALKACLQALGAREAFAPSQVLFREENNNLGVFLLLRGRIRMSVKGLPKLDRVFSAGSVLGLPSTFTGHAYSLTAMAVTEAATVHVPQASFLQLMKERADLCREATEMLGREVTFIQAALAERRRQAARSRLSPAALGAFLVTPPDSTY
jgi:hypothetical protein